MDGKLDQNRASAPRPGWTAFSPAGRRVAKLRGRAAARLDRPVLRLYIAVASAAQVAQSVEQRTENPRVGGSIPPLGTS